MNENEEVVAKFEKNSREEVWLTVDDFRGRKIINIRVYYRSETGEWCPGKQGLAISVERYRDLAEAVLKVGEKLAADGIFNIGQSTPSHNFQNSIQANTNRSRTVEHRKLGRKGYEQVEDYLIPAIRLMRQGNNHVYAFQTIAKKLDVTYQTVNAQCTRRLGISTDDFIEFVKNGQILRLIKNKHPEKHEMINRELENLY